MPENMIMIIDGYIDTPGCLGVPPYLSPLARYIFGAIKIRANIAPLYLTIDQFRLQVKTIKKSTFFQTRQSYKEKQILYEKFLHIIQNQYKYVKIIIFLSGVAVPGKYLSGHPITYSELKKFTKFFPNSLKILCGPSTEYGIGGEGGKPSKEITSLLSYFSLIIKGDAEIGFLNHYEEILSYLEPYSNFPKIRDYHRKDMSDLHLVSQNGADLIFQHPNFNKNTGGNLICEIETFRGCPRHKSGGCSFCIEPTKGETQHRPIEDIVSEIKSLYQNGVRHFRIGNQTDFYAYQHGDYEKTKYPKPNPAVIKELFEKIWKNCPDIETLHIDNVNALNFILYPDEAIKITKYIIEYCTSGNIAAIGVESVDPNVIRMNNLKANEEEITEVIKTINKFGRIRGDNGLPKFLPGLNFIMGLPGETNITLKKDFQFLKRILENDLLLRRINLRKYIVSVNHNSKYISNISDHLHKFSSKYYHWREKIRQEIDLPMMKKIFPLGLKLVRVYAEKHEGKATILRQPGTYPIICYVPTKLQLHQYYDLVVINHGPRSITCLKSPIIFKKLSLRELQAIDGLGKKRAQNILVSQPKTKKEWMNIVNEKVWQRLIKIQPNLIINSNE